MYKVADLSPTHFRKQSYSRHRWYQARSKILVSRVWGLDSGPNLQPFMLAEYTYTDSSHGNPVMGVITANEKPKDPGQAQTGFHHSKDISSP